jgi:hypothetical protein
VSFPTRRSDPRPSRSRARFSPAGGDARRRRLQSSRTGRRRLMQRGSCLSFADWRRQ